MDWLASERGVRCETYAELWRWSVADIDAFWAAVAAYFDVRFDAPPGAVLGRREMPGTEWFAGATRVLYGARPARPRRRRDRDPPRLRAAAARRDDVGRAACGCRADPGGAARARCRPRRPRRRLHAEHPRDDRRVPRGVGARRDLVELLAGLRRALGHRPLRADRAEGPARRRRLPLRRARPRPQRRRGADPRRGRRGARAPRLPRCDRLGGRLPRRGGRGDRARRGALRPPAVGPVLQRHDGAAEGHRPRPRRDPARAPQEAQPPPRRARRRPDLLVHDDGLDDVELPRRRAAHAGVDRPLRRQSGSAALARPPVGARRRGADHVLRDERGVHRELHEGACEARGRPRPERAAQRRLDRVAAVARGLSLGLRRAAR